MWSILWQHFLEIMFFYSLVPFVNRPTRVTANSATIIDTIYSNEIRNDQLSGILYTDISDFFLIFIVYCSCTTYDQHQYIVKRHYTCDNILKFENTLKEIAVSSLLNSNDPQHAFTNFHDNLNIWIVVLKNMVNKLMVSKTQSNKNNQTKKWALR